MRKLQYFLGIEVSSNQNGIFPSQHNYVADMLKEMGLSNAKPADTPLEASLKLEPNVGVPLQDQST